MFFFCSRDLWIRFFSWLALVGSGWIWLALAGSGWLWIKERDSLIQTKGPTLMHPTLRTPHTIAEDCGGEYRGRQHYPTTQELLKLLQVLLGECTGRAFPQNRIPPKHSPKPSEVQPKQSPSCTIISDHLACL